MSDVFDRDAAREKLTGHAWRYWSTDTRLDALEACVRATPQQTIDRDAFLTMLEDIEDGEHMFDQDELYQGVLALLRPVDALTEKLEKNL